MDIIKTNNMTKRYGDVLALTDFSATVEKGNIYALIGKNGAGKTTFMKLITGFTKATSGDIETNISEKDCFENDKIGVLLENPGLLLNLSGYDNLKVKCICHGRNSKGYINDLLRLVDLERDGKKKAKNYSLGMKQRLGLAMALAGEPKILVLDEPTNGLDPHGISFFRKLLVKINKEKDVTIIISSHILEEVSKIATKYAIIHHGVLLEELSSEELESKCDELGQTIEDYYFSLTEYKA